MTNSKVISAAMITIFNCVEVISDDLFNDNEKRSFLDAFEDAFDHRQDERSKRKKFLALNKPSYVLCRTILVLSLCLVMATFRLPSEYPKEGLKGFIMTLWPVEICFLF